MEQRLRNDARYAYQTKIIVLEVARMLCGFIQGQVHPKFVKKEQGPIDGWDDLWVEEFDGTSLHYQIKKQREDFDDNIDKCFKGIAAWIKSNEAIQNPKLRRCRIVVPNDNLRFGPNLDLQRLVELCQVLLKDDVDLSKIEVISNKDAFKAIFAWLINECGFVDVTHVAKGLQILSIASENNPDDIDAKAVSDLSHCFKSPQKLRDEIEGKVSQNHSFINAISPRKWLTFFVNELRDDLPRWTLYELNGTNWGKNGIHDLGDVHVERPMKLVPSLWKPNRSCELIFQAPVADASQELSLALIRLSLHMHRDAVVRLVDKSSWEREALNIVGKTLGDGSLTESLNELNFRDKANRLMVIDEGSIKGPVGPNEESKALHGEMSNLVAGIVCETVDRLVADLDASNQLYIPTFNRWERWKTILIDNVVRRNHLFEGMLRPSAEGKSISAVLRVGPKTAKLIADGIFMSLVVSVSLGGSDTDWFVGTESADMKIIGVRTWSGPSNGDRKVRKVYVGEKLDQLLENDKPKVLLLSGTESSPSQIFKRTLADEDLQSQSFAAKHHSAVLVTNSNLFEMAIANGDMTGIAAAVKERLDGEEARRSKSIRKAMGYGI